ncbi:MAG: class I SAM-dependent methyltransferase [Candidatus Altiarchaeota archaeon]
MPAVMSGEYSEKGEYHKHIKDDWTYYPVYAEKIRFIDEFLSGFPKEKKILDVGCGEGVIVEKYRGLGYDIIGMDSDYHSELVVRGDVRRTDFDDESFDLILLLDVIEHLNVCEHGRVLDEVHRILKPGGMLIATIPNLAHLLSRISFMMTGDFIRTSTVDRHPGDRPINEYRKLISEKFEIMDRRGLFPTFPVSSLLTYWFPRRMVFWHRILNTFLAYPNWCFLNIFVCRRK